MNEQIAAQALADFVSRYSGIHIESTSATPVNYSGVLYNVDGSTPDPKIDGATWKQLLINYGINSTCYVTSPLPGGSTSHPQFSVGGHMTANADGSVPTGGSCYLMPLCYWHNSTSNNGVAFQHTNTYMLQLSGYMQGELAATFLARMPGDAPLRIVGADGNQLTIQPVDGPGLSAMKTPGMTDEPQLALPPHYIVFRQVEEAGRMRYVIEEVALP
ncbi:hypothetical protein [Rhizobium sp. AAP43]|uniref:hypothetical protein n=1 Tax=Rhizobium sp. AAP43 TaxID=1523420 RepID=UPI0006B936DE|nr:hypothetical protein [Rhizobium sp. AAP43]KPF46227.1 hypothetical protein IP76_04790 [Rhizobium sp. AAP43]